MLMIRPMLSASHDYYYRLKQSQLDALALEPLSVEAVDGRGGSTEWKAAHDGRVISIEWDWARLDDGAIVLDRVAQPRTNLMLITPSGYDVGPDETAVILSDFLGRYPWQGAVVTCLRKQISASSGG